MSAPLDVADYQARRYGPQPCWELVADIYAARGAAIPVAYHATQRSVRAMADAFRLALHAGGHGFVRTEVPADYAIVLLGRNAHLGIHHCGLWYGGRILHAEPNLTLYEERHAVAARYALMEFWIHAD